MRNYIDYLIDNIYFIAIIKYNKYKIIKFGDLMKKLSTFILSLIFLASSIFAMERDFNDLEKSDREEFHNLNRDNLFLSLPNEVLIKIIAYVVYEQKFRHANKNFVSIKNTCKLLTALASDKQISQIMKPLWDYHLQLNKKLCDELNNLIDQTKTHKMYKEMSSFDSDRIWNKMMELIVAGADPDCSDLTDTPLIIAVKYSFGLTLVKQLVDNGADVNQTVGWGYTPLILAAANGSIGIAEILLNNGAHINKKCTWGKTAFDYAKQEKKTKMIKFLKKNGANHNSCIIV